MTVEPLRREDTPEAVRLLEQNGLPSAGFAEHLQTAIAARENGRIIGTVALEVYEHGALLRSVAVVPDLHGHGFGQQLTEAAIDLARAKGVPAIYLLTTTAEHFFPKFGFERITRAEVPADVRQSVEFTSACPASAVVMRKVLERRVERVIFACVHNAGRSQMAAAFFSRLADPMRAEAVSAGTQPGERVHPEVIEVMREVGVDLSGARPQLLTNELARNASHLITMGCGDACPYVPGLKKHDWPLADPKGRELSEVRQIRDETRERVEAFVNANAWNRRS